MVEDALIKKVESMSSLAYMLTDERSLTMDVEALTNRFIILDISKSSRVLACGIFQLSLRE